MSSGNPWVIVLDRDGVINEDSPEYIKSPAEWRPLAGSLEAIALLNKAGFRVTVATNQSGIGRGLFDTEMLAAIHRKMLDAVRLAGGHIARIVYCPHTPEDQCACRKPAPGMLFEIAEAMGCGLKNLILIGDAERDLQAARAAGARSILVRTGKGRSTELSLPAAERVEIHEDLRAAAASLISELEGFK